MSPRSSYSLPTHLFIQQILSECYICQDPAFGPGSSVEQSREKSLLQRVYALGAETDNTWINLYVFGVPAGSSKGYGEELHGQGQF